MATINPKDNIKEKLEYLGLDLENIPRNLQEFQPLDFMVLTGYDDSQYKQYRYIPIKDIQILLSPTHRLDDIEKKYKSASPLCDYLDSKNERNVMKHATFLKMLKSVRIDDIEKIEEEQKELNKKIPFRVKYEGNYLWQIYYSENTDKYFMMVPTEDSDYSTFFYLLKKQIESRRTGKIFVPVRNIEYSTKYLKRRQFEELENYLWIFTNDWALIYEVYDRLGNMSIQIVGQTQVYGKIKSPYKIKLSSKEEAVKFYRLLRALFILQTELPHFYNFKTNINRTGSIEFYQDDQIIQYETLAQFINDGFRDVEEKEKNTIKQVKKYREMLKNLKIEATGLELEYLTKERQISTFLECKKTFFGKVKYYFKYSKKRPSKFVNEDKGEVVKPKEERQEEKENEREKIKTKQFKKVVTKNNYTIEELIKQCKEYDVIESEMKNLLMDINAIKLKNKNMKKKIENATLFIEEIDNHKKSIFEFWKYSNKDEVAQLAEGEAEEVNVTKKVEKVFDYEQDIEKFGEKLDEKQRKLLSKEELDSIYITATNQLDIMNKVKENKVLPKDIELSLKQLKIELKEQQTIDRREDFDIFGSLMDTKVREINNQRHRESPKDKFRILEVTKNTKQIGYKLTLERIIENISKAIEKIQIHEDIVVYKAIAEGRLRHNDFNVFELNPQLELERIFSEYGNTNKITLYKINIKKGANAIAYTNSIYYDNQHKTLPIGMNIDSKILVDTNKLDLEEIDRRTFKIIKLDENIKEGTRASIKTVNVVEYEEIKVEEEQKEEK